ncbi:Vegetative incompatibility protein HET-E-1 [Colletotrichum viniferum]|nr:Vegetative incompatibility protein HET-E-1 [Colletotrichum viniferum]
MWLINITDTQALHLEPFLGDPPAQYAILSHTWGDDEVTFDKFNAMTFDIRNSAGFVKILNAALLARRHGFVYLWVDTCCIDKASSAELSESINSMYLWYLKATVCYAYLSDVHPDGIRSMGQRESQFRASRWFTRGWTLQELIAPRVVEFYASDWSLMDTKKV